MNFLHTPRDKHITPLRHSASIIFIVLTLVASSMSIPIDSTNQTSVDYSSTPEPSLIYNTSLGPSDYNITDDGFHGEVVIDLGGVMFSVNNETSGADNFTLAEDNEKGIKISVSDNSTLAEDQGTRASTSLQNVTDQNDIQNDDIDTTDDSFQDNNTVVIDIITTNTDTIPNMNPSTCQRDMNRLVSSMTSEPWVIPFVDSWGKPGPSVTENWVNFVGNYEQCQRSAAPPSRDGHDGFEGQYCLVKLHTPGTPIQPTSGLCFPDSCSSSELQFFLTGIIQSFNITTSTSNQDGENRPIPLSVFIECLNADTDVTPATAIAIIVVTFIFLLVATGTIYDYVYVQKWQLKPPNAFYKSLVAFSAYTNSKLVLKTSSSSTDSIDSIHGIRFISMCWIIMGHVYFTGTLYSINEGAALAGYLDRRTFDPISNTYLSVDTFFALSGLLVAFLTIKELSKIDSWRINWAMFYFHRFWRLTPAYMFVLLTVLGFQQYLGDGPLWSNDQPVDKTNCENNWWANLLYVNNLVNTDEMCMTHSWYLANDMQFYVLSPVLLIPFYFNRIYGLVTCGCFLLASWITTGVTSADHHWPTSELVYQTHRNQDWFESYYVKPWNRIGPFIVGVLAGYALIQIKGKSLVLNLKAAVLGWVIAASSALAVVYGIHGDYSRDEVSSNSVAAVYNALHRTVWSASVCWVIVSCESGFGGPVVRFLSWSPFKVFGRLTYTTYLVHPVVISVLFQNMGLLYYSNDAIQVTLFLGVCVLSYLLAFVCVLAVESPMVGLEKAWIRKAE